MSLTGKVAIVTGGAKGIGYAIAADLARRGAAILIADLEGADAAAKRLRDEGRRAVGVKVDVASEADTAAMAKAATAELGGADILVNNAAIFSTLKRQPFEEIDPAAWRRVMEVNTLGIFLCCRAVLPALQGARRRAHRQHLLGRRLQGQSGHGALRREQGRGGLADAVARHRARPLQHPRQQRGAGLHAERGRAREPRADPGRARGLHDAPACWRAT